MKFQFLGSVDSSEKDFTAASPAAAVEKAKKLGKKVSRWDLFSGEEIIATYRNGKLTVW